MKMPIDRETLIKQLEFLEEEIKKKLIEIKECEDTLQATKKLLGTYKAPPFPSPPGRIVNNLNSTIVLSVPPQTSELSETFVKFYSTRHVTGNKISGSTSVEAIEIILSKETLSLAQLTEKLIKLGHFTDNKNPKSSVHVTLTRRDDKFARVTDKNGVKWKLR